MEEDRESTRYWCHQCNSPVVPILEVEAIKCSRCHGEFMEEMDSVRSDHHHHHHLLHHRETGSGTDTSHDRGQSTLAPFLLGMMNNPRRRRRFTHIEFDDDDEEDRHNSFERYRSYNFQEGDSELDRDFETIMRRRARSSATILHLLQGARSGTHSDSENNPERVILINPFNQTIILQGSGGGTHQIGSLGDYFSGPGLDQLLQHLSENDPNRLGTPPAQKEAVDAMPTVKIEDKSVQCSVCLDEFEVGIEAKEMPCKHKFHSKCILPWLELHSSCPVCRFELPSDERKDGSENVGDNENGDGGHVRRVSLPWPFNGFFSSTSGTQTGSTSGSGSSPQDRGPGPEEDNH